jgi:hypothetical protein
LGISNPWDLVPLFVFRKPQVFVKVRTKGESSVVPISRANLTGLYYLCLIKDQIETLNNKKVVRFDSELLEIDLASSVQGRQMEMIYYSKRYGLTLAEHDHEHYLVKTADGISFIVKKDEDVGNIGEVFVDNIYGKLLGDVNGRIVIDVGASMGDTSIYFATRGAKEVYAFEPDIEEFELATENIALNKIDKIKIYNDGIGPNRVSLGQLLEQLPYPVLLKIDCEGCEFEAIESLSAQSFEKLERLVIEYHGTPHQIQEKLSQFGFKVKVFSPWTHMEEIPIGYITARKI